MNRIFGQNTGYCLLTQIVWYLQAREKISLIIANILAGEILLCRIAEKGDPFLK